MLPFTLSTELSQIGFDHTVPRWDGFQQRNQKMRGQWSHQGEMLCRIHFAIIAVLFSCTIIDNEHYFSNKTHMPVSPVTQRKAWNSIIFMTCIRKDKVYLNCVISSTKSNISLYSGGLPNLTPWMNVILYFCRQNLSEFRIAECWLPK